MSIASWMASENLSWRLIMGDRSGKHVPAEFRPLRKRTLAGKRYRVVDLRRDLGIHGHMRGLIDHAVILERLAVQADGTSRGPGVELLLRAIPEMQIAEGTAMFEPAIG